MTLCPIALAVGCQKCPALKICPLKRVLGDKPKAASVVTNPEARVARQVPAKKMVRPKLARAKAPKVAAKKAAPKKAAVKAGEKPAAAHVSKAAPKPAAKPAAKP